MLSMSEFVQSLQQTENEDLLLCNDEQKSIKVKNLQNEDTEDEEIDVVSVNPFDDEPSMQKHWRKRAVELCREMQEAEQEKQKRLKLYDQDDQLPAEVMVISERAEEEESDKEENNKLITVSTVCLDSSKLPMISIIHEPDTDEPSLQYLTKNGVILAAPEPEIVTLPSSLTPDEKVRAEILLRNPSWSKPRERSVSVLTLLPRQKPPSSSRKHSKIPTVKEMLMAKRAGKPIPIPKEEIYLKLPKKPNFKPPVAEEERQRASRKGRITKTDNEVLDNIACRTVHNTLEKFRRANMRQSFAKLQAIIPSICSTGRVAKVRIIQEAQQYIQHLGDTFRQRELLIEELTTNKYNLQIALRNLKTQLSKNKSMLEIHDMLDSCVPVGYQSEDLEDPFDPIMTDNIFDDPDPEADENEVDQLEDEIIGGGDTVMQELYELSEDKTKVMQKLYKLNEDKTKSGFRRRREEEAEGSKKVELIIQTIKQMQQQIMSQKNKEELSQKLSAKLQQNKEPSVSEDFVLELQRLKKKRESSSQIRSSTPPPPSSITTPFFPRFSLPGGGSPPLLNSHLSSFAEDELPTSASNIGLSSTPLIPTAAPNSLNSETTISTSENELQINEEDPFEPGKKISVAEQQISCVKNKVLEPALIKVQDSTNSVTSLCYEMLTQPPRLATSESPSSSQTSTSSKADGLEQSANQLPLIQALAKRSVTELQNVVLASLQTHIPKNPRQSAQNPRKLLKSKTFKVKNTASVSCPVDTPLVSGTTSPSDKLLDQPDYSTTVTSATYKPLTTLNIQQITPQVQQLLPKCLQELISSNQVTKAGDTVTATNNSIPMQRSVQTVPVMVKTVRLNQNPKPFTNNTSSASAVKLIAFDQTNVQTQCINVGGKRQIVKFLPISASTKVIGTHSQGIQFAYIPTGTPMIASVNGAQKTPPRRFKIVKTTTAVSSTNANTNTPITSRSSSKSLTNKEIFTIPLSTVQHQVQVTPVSMACLINKALLGGAPTFKINKNPVKLMPKHIQMKPCNKEPMNIIITTSPTPGTPPKPSNVPGSSEPSTPGAKS